MYNQPEGSAQEDAPLSFEIMVMRTINQMIQAKASNDMPKYWSFFEDSMGLMLSYIDPEIKQKLEASMDAMKTSIKAIKNGDSHESTKEKEILELHVEFANEHKYYIYKSLSRSGIIKVKDEGFIDLQKRDVDKYAQLVRDASIKDGLGRIGGSLSEAPAKEEKKEGAVV